MQFKYSKPTEYFVDARKVIPGGSQTMSKAAEKYVLGVYPEYLVRANGCVVEDAFGNGYTDYICGLGPIVLGYNHRSVTKAAIEAINAGGPTFPLPHPSETGLCEMLSGVYPSAQMSRLFKSGSDALSAAVRVARAYTGKYKIAVCGYHGWHEWYAVSTDKKGGIPPIYGDYVKTFNYNDPQSLLDLFEKDDYAAVIFEPVVYDEPKDDFVLKVIEIAHQHEALVVFDEVVTGFRYGLSGASGMFNAHPDLACFSKGMANGYPIGALSGRRDVMRMFERPDILISGTFGGEFVSIMAAMATIYALRDNDHLNLKRIWTAGNRIKEVFNGTAKMLDLPLYCRGYAPRTDFVFENLEHKALFWQECVKAGVLFGYANFTNAAHSASIIEHTCGVMEASLRVVKEHWKAPLLALEGKLPQSPFVKR